MSTSNNGRTRTPAEVRTRRPVITDNEGTDRIVAEVVDHQAELRVSVSGGTDSESKAGPASCCEAAAVSER